MAGLYLMSLYLNFDNCQPEVVSDVISSAFVETTDMKAHAKIFTVLEIYDCLTLLGTTITTTTQVDGAYAAFCLKSMKQKER